MINFFSANTRIPVKTNWTNLAPLWEEYNSELVSASRRDEVWLEEEDYRHIRRNYGECGARNLYAIYKHFNDGCEATTKALYCAITKKIAFHLGGGYHHATLHLEDAQYGCLLNDFLTAANKFPYLNVSVLDLDFHLGGGSFNGSRDINNLTIYDVAFKSGALRLDAPKGIDISNTLVETNINYFKLMNQALDQICSNKPDVVIYNAGADVTDKNFAKNQALSLSDIDIRDRQVLTRFKDYNIPVAITLGGGYNQQALDCWRQLIGIAQELYE